MKKLMIPNGIPDPCVRRFVAPTRVVWTSDQGVSGAENLLRDDADALLREVLLDRANGLHGKTVIHPTHVTIVNALHAVSREEHDDALTVLMARGRGGALASSSHNKMNEVGPHELWAAQLLARARAYGVLASPDAVLELLHRGRLVSDTRFAARTVPVP